MKRFLVALAAGGIVFAVAFAAAAALDVDGGTIQAGTDDSLTCDTDGVDVLGWGLETDDGLVYFVRIGDISADCEGNDLFASISDINGDTLTKATAVNPIDATEEKLTFVTPQPAADIYDIEVFIEGPN